MTDIAGLEVGLPAGVGEVTAAWMTDVLRTSGAIDAAARVESCTTVPYRAGGLLSLLFRSTLTYAAGGGPATVICKFPTDVPHQRLIADVLQAYPREVAFYRDVAPRSNIRTPEIHAAMIADDHSHYCLVMEDLGHLRQPDRLVGMDWDEALAGVDALAAFHAGWYGSPELETLSARFVPLSDPLYRTVLPGVYEQGWPAAKQHGGDLLSDEAIALGDQWADRLQAMLDHMEVNPTMCHCDWRADNMFIDADGSIIVIDPQIASVGNGAFDLGYFISQSIEREVRSGREDELLARYAEALRAENVRLDTGQLAFETRVAVAAALIYGIAAFPEFEALDQESRNVQRTILRRAVNACEDLDALGAIEQLPRTP